MLVSFDNTKTSLSAANPFLAADGFLNVASIIKSGAALQKAVDNMGEAAPKLTGCYVISTKAKPGNYSAAKDKARDFKYLTTRLVKVAERKRLPKEGVSVLLFPTYDKLPRDLSATQRSMVSAVSQHMKKLEKEAEKIKGEKADIRDAANAAFNDSVDLLRTMLNAIPEAARKQMKFAPDRDMVESTGMFGKTVLIKVGPQSVISIGKSDLAKFNAAKRAARAGESA